MIKRYHKNVYFPNNAREVLESFSARMNVIPWKYTEHCIDNIIQRAGNIENVLRFIKGMQLNAQNVFEYYMDGGAVERAVYRVKYSENVDLIVVVGTSKHIITIYFNDGEDNHATLNSAQYERMII